MAVLLKDVLTKKEYKEFVYLPEKIHKGHKDWLPPLYMDEKVFFDPQKNHSFNVCDHRLILAYRDGIAVGRIMGIINRQYNEMMGVKNARFGFIETYNDQEVIHALITEIENWGRDKGMNKIVGPFGFSDREPQGLLIKGFEYEPVIDSACNFEYLPKLVENEGYTKELDCGIFRYPLSNPLPEVIYKIFDRITSRKDLQFLEFKTKKQIKPWIVPVFRAMNESFGDIYGFVPMNETEMQEMAKKYLPVIDLEFVKVVAKEDKVIAFMISMPNMYKGLQKAKGRLLPFGLFHILRAMKTAKSVNTMLGAVVPEHQKRGLDIYFTLTTIQTAVKRGMTSIDTHVVMEENNDMMVTLQRYGAFQIKKFRVFQKEI
jgi:hypothetical protein